MFIHQFILIHTNKTIILAFIEEGSIQICIKKNIFDWNGCSFLKEIQPPFCWPIGITRTTTPNNNIRRLHGVHSPSILKQRNSTAEVTPLAAGCCEVQAQNLDPSFGCSQQDGSCIPQGHHQAISSSKSPLLCDIGSPRDPCTKRGPTRTLPAVSLLPQWWNDHHTQLRTSPSKRFFRRILKSHLFKLWYSMLL